MCQTTIFGHVDLTCAGIAPEGRVQIWLVDRPPVVDSFSSIPPQMKPGVFREEYIAIIVKELLKGLEYLHSEGKLHRDIKGSFR